MHSPVTEKLKTLYDEIPWPHAYALSPNDYATVKSELPAHKSHAGFLFGMRIEPNPDVPPNQILAISLVRDGTGFRREVVGLINIGDSEAK
jgi:hypothetical protein